MIQCYIKGKNFVDGVETTFRVAEGAVFIENYNETLDSGTIILPQLSSKIDIAPYDIVIISGNNIEDKRMLVDTYTCTQTSLDPTIYEYEISLFSETKLLEGVVLPSLAITKLKYEHRTIESYIREYVDQYSPKVLVSGTYVNKFDVGDISVNNTYPFDNECPELQWNEPTLREVLTDLMMTKDCIPILKDNIISCIKISDVSGEISSSKRSGINYIRESQSSSDYLSELKMNLKNVMGTTNVVYDNITFRNYDSHLLTSENIKIETSRPIWNLNNFVATLNDIQYNASFYITTTQIDIPLTTYGAFSSNLTNYVLEYGEWQTRPIYYSGFGNTQPLSTSYQNTCLYYIREQRGIHNWEGKQDGKSLWVSIQRSVLELVINYILNECKMAITRQILDDYPEAEDISISFQSNTFRDLMFLVTYDAIGEQTFLASKKDKFGIRQVVDNQTQSYIDIQRQGVLEYFKANRLGNKIKTINARYDDVESNLPQLAEKVDGSIIFQKQISVYSNHIKANYLATDSYVLRDYFTGIKARLRSYPILTGDQAFVRADIIKFFVGSNIQTYNNRGYIIPSFSLAQTYLNNFNYCFVTFKDKYGTSLIPSTISFNGSNVSVNAIQVEFQKSICGNSVLFTIRMYDNSIAGEYIQNDRYEVDAQSSTYLMAQQICRYTDNNGENYGGTIMFFQNKESMSDADKFRQAKILPYANTSFYNGLICQIPFSYHKDNKEITQITIQFEINSDANDIFLGKV